MHYYFMAGRRSPVFRLFSSVDEHLARKRFGLFRSERKIPLAELPDAGKNLNGSTIVDLACGSRLERLIKYASEHPHVAFVGVDIRPLAKSIAETFSALPNLYFVRAGALEALKLVKPSSKSVINMDNFPYFDRGSDFHENVSYRKKLFRGIHSALRPRGLLTLTTNHAKLARTELEENGFKIVNSKFWGSEGLGFDLASRYTKALSSRNSMELIVARKRTTKKGVLHILRRR